MVSGRIGLRPLGAKLFVFVKTISGFICIHGTLGAWASLRAKAGVQNEKGTTSASSEVPQPSKAKFDYDSFGRIRGRWSMGPSQTQPR